METFSILGLMLFESHTSHLGFNESASILDFFGKSLGSQSKTILVVNMLFKC